MQFAARSIKQFVLHGDISLAIIRGRGPARDRERKERLIRSLKSPLHNSRRNDSSFILCSNNTILGEGLFVDLGVGLHLELFVVSLIEGDLLQLSENEKMKEKNKAITGEMIMIFKKCERTKQYKKENEIMMKYGIIKTNK